MKGFTPVLDNTGKITGYKTSVGGADTVFPFSGSGEYELVFIKQHKLNESTEWYWYETKSDKNLFFYACITNSDGASQYCVSTAKDRPTNFYPYYDFSGAYDGAIRLALGSDVNMNNQTYRGLTVHYGVAKKGASIGGFFYSRNNAVLLVFAPKQ